MLTDEPVRPLRAVLVANRGEIAVRVIRAARDAGVRSIAVHAEPDRGALHTRLADDVVALNGTDVASTYLNGEAVVQAALAAGADAVHPGYGFLAEDADFARTVMDAGLTWIGPPPDAIRLLGDKVSARRVARSVGAPLAAGTLEPVGNADEVVAFAQQHGLPLVIKAAYGGGGRGLKVVRDIGEVEECFASASREAVAAFGRGDCFLERYLDRARHVEAQVLADTHGTVLVIGTRDCSLQRRNQKLVEEAPPPFLPDAIRLLIEESAERICRAAGYVGAGTVEYLVGPGGEVSFLEVNTRLQVEHPVTEETSGVDLVVEQFRIAAGAKLVAVAAVPSRHSIEFRLTSEDPACGFAPVPGTIDALRVPTGPGVRFDPGVEVGDAVDGRFDSMFAKLIVTGADRTQAMCRARRALAELDVRGVPTPIPFYRQLLEHPDFVGDSFRVHNRWIETEFDGRIDRWSTPSDAPRDPLGDELPVRIGRKRLAVAVPGLDLVADAAEIRRRVGVGEMDRTVAHLDTFVRTPMQGTVVDVVVVEGQRVSPGDIVAVVEAMKMENRVASHRAGVVTRVEVAVGDYVAHLSVLCEIGDG